MNILIYVDHEAGTPKRTALELAGKAQQIATASGGRAVAVVLGAAAGETVQRLGQAGIDDVYTGSEEVFDSYLSGPQVDAVELAVKESDAQAILFSDTLDGRDVASRLAARLDCGLVSAVVGLELHEGSLRAEETIFGGAYTTEVEVADSSVSIFLVRPNAFSPVEAPREPAVHQLRLEVTEQAKLAKLGKKIQEEGSPEPLEEAGVIVSGGRGLGGPEPFAMLQELAGELGGVVGASRAAVDAGWIPYSHQVGQTGRTVKPQLYVAIGISGAVQHRAGMQTADTVVAVNRDPDATIFQLADLGVVGDLFKIVPALTQEIRRRKGA
ncbi:MAG: electron transfer flavoprotein subunit alpha/FixB family protein [Chloroflexota bacterium]